jgi:replicative DNA helicase
MSEVFPDAQLKLIQICYQHYDLHSSFPSMDVLKRTLSKEARVESKMELLDEYAKYSQYLKEVPISDLDFYLDLIKEDTEKARLDRYLTCAREICINQVETEGRDKVLLKGPRDAIAYLSARFSSGFSEGDPTRWCGSSTDLSDSLSRDVSVHVGVPNSVKTGIPALDAIGGLRNGSFVTVLSYTGGRKTTLCRNIAFNVAKDKRVLCIPLESDPREEMLVYYSWISSDLGHPVSLADLQGNTITQAQADYLRDTVHPEFIRRFADRLMIQSPGVYRDWATIKGMVQRSKADLVIIDYLALARDPKEKDDIQAVTKIIMGCKHLALSLNIPILSPAQANRAGFKAAGENDGVYSPEAIYQYSELEKSSDLVLSTYTDDAFNASGEIVFSALDEKVEKCAFYAAF